MNSAYTFQAIVVMAVVTFLIRAFPFLLFGRKNARPPELVLYLGNVIAPAALALLVVYCVRNVEFLGAPFGAPELIAIAAVAGLHLWKRNVLLSIAGGTVLYMVLVQAVFV